MVGEIPPAVLTVMSTVPAVEVGEVSTQEVVVQLTTVDEDPPKRALVDPEMKPVPVTVTEVPPARGPAIGLIAVIVGTAS